MWQKFCQMVPFNSSKSRETEGISKGSMSRIKLTIGQYSSAGRKPENQDSYGMLQPAEPLLSSKGIAVGIADGASGSEGGKEASELCIRSFLEDYYCTHDSWTIETSVGRVLTATNRWLYSQAQARFQSEHGLVSTLSGMILKDGCGHIFHIGDSRIYKVGGKGLECLTTDHTLRLRKDHEYLKRAMGLEAVVEIDYRKIGLTSGDVFVFMTDGIYKYLPEEEIVRILASGVQDLDGCAKGLGIAAFEAGSTDNTTCQILRIDETAAPEAGTFRQSLAHLPFPPDLTEGNTIDGYRILRQLHATTRSQVYLAHDPASETEVILKTPSAHFSDDPDYIDQFTREDWIARRLNSPHVVASGAATVPRTFLYSVLEYVQGQTLRQWMDDHDDPPLDEVRSILEQIAKGLRAFHRMEMVHRDLKPENIMIDRYSTVKIIDFGSTRVSGLEGETNSSHDRPPGTVSYTAPEYLSGSTGTNQSDIFSLGVIAYEILTGVLPYGPGFESPAKIDKLRLTPACDLKLDLPTWISASLAKALEKYPSERYVALSEFTTDMSKPNKKLVPDAAVPLLERNPTAFWRGLALSLLGLTIMLGTYILKLISG